MPNQEVTTGELLIAIQSIDTRLDLTKSELLSAIQKTDQTVQALSVTVQDLSGRVDDLAINMNEFASHTEERFQRIEAILPTFATKDDLVKLEVRMVSKSYLDAKLADQYSDLAKLFEKKLAQAKF